MNMKQAVGIMLATLCGLMTAGGAIGGEVAADADLASRTDAIWAKAMETWNPRTGVVTGCALGKSPPPADAKNNLYKMYEGRPGGWGPGGVGDAPLICGTALAGLADKWAVTRDPAVRTEAAKVAKGVLNLAILHGYKGFVCRGFCSDDKTTVSLSSRDQYTHWVHGLWRYVTEPGLAEPALAAEYRRRIAEVAAFMERRVTEASGWNFGLADSPEKDYRGICTMWGPEVWPHEAARLPMIYCAAFLATGDGHWRDLYETYIDEALERTLKIRTLAAHEIAGRMPCYSLYQANVSLDLILAYEKERNPSRTAKIQEAMAIFAKHARNRAKGANPARPPYGMCWDGELALTQLLAPEIPEPEELADFIAGAIRRTNPSRMDACRAAHVMAAWWRQAWVGKSDDLAWRKKEPFTPLTNLQWRLPPCAKIEGNILTVSIPTNRPGWGLVSADVDLSAFNSRGFEAKIETWGENVMKCANPSLGFKFMIPYKDPTSGNKSYPGVSALSGTFDRRCVRIIERQPRQGRIHATVVLGLQEGCGTVHYDLSTLGVRSLSGTSKLVNQDFRVKYPASVSRLPVLRGVMLPGRPCKEKDLADLAAWGATLARYQMCVRGDGEEYDKDLDFWVTRLEEDILAWARKYGIRLIIDLHTPPGDRYRPGDVDPNGCGCPSDVRMLYEKRYARKFIEIWKSIARRLKGNEDIIYGYDLCNEPVQYGQPVGIDSLELQRLAAEAVRKIDPKTTIVIEADDWDNPEAFARLSPLRMDNVIYQFHMYRPHELTHQRVGGDKDSTRPLLPYPCKEKGWDKAYLRERMQDVVAFQRKHSARILVGEFSCIVWTPGADRYIADVIDLFEEYGWDWTYHAYREWEGWSVEHEWPDPNGRPVPSADNPRMRALRSALRRGAAD